MIKKIKNLPYPILGGAIGLGLATVILNIGFFQNHLCCRACRNWRSSWLVSSKFSEIKSREGIGYVK